MNPPPFLVSFTEDKDALKAALSPETIQAHWATLEFLIDARFPPAVSIEVLSCLFGFSRQFIGALSHSPESHYRTFRIKKGTKTREIHAPRVGLKVVQKWLGHHLAKALRFDDCVYGFVPKRSAPMAAAVHCEAQWIYSLDLANFFPTTSIRYVAEALERIGYPSHSAELVAALCCYKNHLAQGSPTSPVLSNLVFRQWDQRLAEIATETHSRYTRYVDDLVFSGTGDIPKSLNTRVRSVIAETGWKIAAGKERVATRPHRLKVHGLLVHGTSPRLTKGYRNRIRAISHLTESNKVSDKDLARFQGHLAYAKSVARIGGTDR